MVTTKTGNLFSSQAQTLVNTVNCVGVMGKGVALAFKEHFPDMYKDYVRLCETSRVRLGEPYLYKQLAGPWVLNFPTKDHWRSVSRLSDIVEGLNYLEQHYRDWGITSLAVPPLGCGQGGLEWRVVGPTLYRHLQRLDIPIELFAPHGTVPFELTPEFLGNGRQAQAGATRFVVCSANEDSTCMVGSRRNSPADSVRTLSLARWSHNLSKDRLLRHREWNPYRVCVQERQLWTILRRPEADAVEARQQRSHPRRASWKNVGG